MNCGGAPMSSCSPLKIVMMSTPSYLSAFCIRLVYSGLDAAHSSMAICSISSRPHALMQCAIPDRSISWPIKSNSGTSVASSSRESAAYLLVIEAASRVHVQRRVDVALLVLTATLLCILLTLARHLRDDAVELGAQREAEIVGKEDRHLLELFDGELFVAQRRVHLDLRQLRDAERGDAGQRHHSLVAHRQARPGPDGPEEVIRGQREVVPWHVRHLPAVDLVH